MTLNKWRNIAENMLIYIKNYFLKLDLNLQNMFDVKVRKNNQAEGYNYALGSKTHIHILSIVF